jgi:hypothetical protein
MEQNHRIWREMQLRKARYLFPFTEVAGKGRQAFHLKMECLESALRVLDLEDICCMRRRDSLVGSEQRTMAGEPEHFGK